MNKPSDSELEVLKVLWGLGEATVQQVRFALQDKTQWAPNTIKTLLARLHRKGLLAFRKEGRYHIYFPLCQQKEMQGLLVRSFLQTVYDSDIHAFLNNYLKDLPTPELAKFCREFNSFAAPEKPPAYYVSDSGVSCSSAHLRAKEGN